MYEAGGYGVGPWVRILAASMAVFGVAAVLAAGDVVAASPQSRSSMQERSSGYYWKYCGKPTRFSKPGRVLVHDATCNTGRTVIHRFWSKAQRVGSPRVWVRGFLCYGKTPYFIRCERGDKRINYRGGGP